MVDVFTENCPHLRGLRRSPAIGFLCTDCGSRLNMEEVGRWVLEAERARDEAYPIVEGDEFDEIRRGELQREVYRRRKVKYELQNVPRTPVRPEMVLVIHDEGKGSYGCRIFYKEPQPVSGVERLEVGADEGVIADLRSHRDPVIRLVAEKVEGFHGLRTKLAEMGESAPSRRVFYASDL